MTNSLKRILLIEDNLEIVGLIREHLPHYSERFTLETASDGPSGLALAQNEKFDVLLLDLMLPGMGGLDICKQIRQTNQDLLILMLTAKSSELDRVLGLEIGADDYLVKPFSVAELFSRIEALLRRKVYTQLGHPAQTNALGVGDLAIDSEKRIATIAGKPIDLTPTEFAMLLFLAQRPGHTLSRFDLLQAVWGKESDGAEDMVNAHMNRLRRKLSKDRQQYIKTVWGVGYRFATTDE